MRLLLAEDEPAMSEAVVDILEYHRYQVDPVYDGQEALDYIHGAQYDGIILDIMMPKKSGLEVLTQIRREGNRTPVLLLTAKAEIEDRIQGLDAGADDYLTKPFAMKELMARVRALTRRKNEYSGKDLSYNDIKLRSGTFELACENSVRLSVKEFELMQLFMLNQNHCVTSDYILNQVWSREPDAQSDTVWLYVSYLNRKLRAIASGSKIEGDSINGFQLK